MKTVQEHARALGDPTRHALTAQGNELWEAAIRQPATRKTVPLHVISAPEGGRLGDLNTGPTHYETAPPRAAAPTTCCLSTSFVTPSDTKTH